MKKYIILGVIILALLAGAAYAFRDKAVEYAFQPNLPETNSNTNSPATIGGDPEIVAENLSVPWEIVFLPDGDMLITERVGTVKRIGKTNGSYPISGVKAGGGHVPRLTG